MGTILVGMASPQQFEQALAAVLQGPLPQAALERAATQQQEFAGEPLRDLDAVAAAAGRIVASGAVENVAVTLGAEGAVLANASGAEFMPAIAVESRSSVGAGDSFLAAMTYAFASGATASAALRLGVAAGAAATLSPGTNLCHPEDITRLAMDEAALKGVRRFAPGASAGSLRI